MATSHKCEGGWRDGKAAACETCLAKRPFKVGRFVRVSHNPRAARPSRTSQKT